MSLPLSKAIFSFIHKLKALGAFPTLLSHSESESEQVMLLTDTCCLFAICDLMWYYLQLRNDPFYYHFDFFSTTKKKIEMVIKGTDTLNKHIHIPNNPTMANSIDIRTFGYNMEHDDDVRQIALLKALDGSSFGNVLGQLRLVNIDPSYISKVGRDILFLLSTNLRTDEEDDEDDEPHEENDDDER
jgi:hypothetical protein